MVESLLTVDEVAELLRLPRATIYSTRYRGTPPGSLALKVGRYLRFRPEAIDAWLNAAEPQTPAAGSDV